MAVGDASNTVAEAAVPSADAQAHVEGDAAGVLQPPNPNASSPPQRTSMPIALDSDVLGMTPREALAVAAGFHEATFQAPLGNISVRVPESATSASLVTHVFNRFFEVPVDAEVTIAGGEAIRGGRVISHGTRSDGSLQVVFELMFPATRLPASFFTLHPEVAECSDARLVLEWIDAKRTQSGVQLLRARAQPEDPIEVCYSEIAP